MTYWTSDHAMLAEFGYPFSDFSEGDVRCIYALTVDKAEYPEFEGWLWDMERSAVLYRHER